MVRNYILILILTIALGGWTLNHCEAAFGAQTTAVAEGKISAIDTFKSTITVKSLIKYPNIFYKDTLLFIAPNSKIMKGGKALSIFDLKMGSPVTIRYIEGPVVPNTLVSLTITK